VAKVAMKQEDLSRWREIRGPLGRPRRLATTGRNSVREAVAANPSAPSDALVALASDLRMAVVREVAATPASQVGIATGIS
jgi:hypothetical protein